jgi:hypothetical protein
MKENNIHKNINNIKNIKILFLSSFVISFLCILLFFSIYNNSKNKKELTINRKTIDKQYINI